jgi:hypothetical protein
MTKFSYGFALTILLLVGAGRVHAAEQFALCRPVEVMAYANRVHVRCELPVAPNIVFLATSAQPDFRFATRVLALGATAQATQKTLVILFDPADTTGPDFGCAAADCRPIGAIGLSEQSPPTPPPPPMPPTPPMPTPPPAVVSHAQCLQACRDERATCIASAGSGTERGGCKIPYTTCMARCPP